MRISILGSTGSIGQSALRLLRDAPEHIEIATLVGGHNIAQLIEDARHWRPDHVVSAFEEHHAALSDALRPLGIGVASGPDAIAEAAQMPVDVVLSAIVGAAGVSGTYAALAAGNAVALANKESMVCAGALMKETARHNDTAIYPVDSEHAALDQLLRDEPRERLRKVIITASGGAFLDWPQEKLAQVSVAEASSHPNWNMGQRITIDSASLFNKALEVIEAKELFDLHPDQIEVLIHPQSIIHAMACFCDGAMMAHMGVPDMRHAISYGISKRKRMILPLDFVDFAQLQQLTFFAPDESRYPSLRLAKEVIAAQGAWGAVFNGAKEAALDHFIAGHISFLDMFAVVSDVMDKMGAESGISHVCTSIDEVLAWDHLARQSAGTVVRH